MLSDPEIAKHFIKATISVLSTMAGIEPRPGKPYAKSDAHFMGDVSAIVGVTGAKKGSIALSFSKSTAIALVRGMLGDDVQDLVRDVQDAVGEVTNMVSGQARASLSEVGVTMSGSTPSVVIGKDHSIYHMSKGTAIGIPFDTEHGQFTVEFCFE